MRNLFILLSLLILGNTTIAQNLPLAKGYSPEEKDYLGYGSNMRISIVVVNNTDEDMFIKLNGIKMNTKPCKCLEIRNNPMKKYKIVADLDDPSTPWLLSDFKINALKDDIGKEYYYSVNEKLYGADKKRMYSLSHHMLGRPSIAKEVWKNRCIIDKANPANNVYPVAAIPHTPTKTIEKPINTTTNTANNNSNTRPNPNVNNTRPNPNNNIPSVEPDCYPISPAYLNEQITSLNNTRSSFSRKDLAETIVRNNCLSANQIKSVLKTLSGSFDQRDFAIYAYPYCADPQNYTRVIDALSSEIMKDEVREATIGQASPRPNNHRPRPNPRPNPSNTGTVGPDCYPISPAYLNEQITSLNNTRSSFSRKDLAETIVRNNCLSANQTKSVLKTLSGSFDQRDFAIYAYPYCADPQNYIRVIDALSSEIMKDEVRKATISR